MEFRILLLVHVTGFCLGLRDVQIQVPVAVRRGESVTLFCWYETEDDPLYIVKWYKARREFYHFAPKEYPVIKTFPMGNLRVNIERSNATQVTLDNVDIDSADTYSCEVSADAPSFHTAIVSGNMKVVELPEENPTVTGMQRKYKIGDSVKVTCTSGKSSPPTNLTWFINDRPPYDAHVRTISPLETDESTVQFSQITLQFLVTKEHFAHGKLKIRCTASIYAIYWQSSEVSAEEDKLNRNQVNFVPVITATRYGDPYYQPPPNHQTGQKKPDGQIDVKILGSSASSPNSVVQFVLGLLVCLLSVTI
ncbi:uncharacterized protein LOC127280772 [Leptopilina boulardi]|uniref:uncharacterized protein LOC127280772 n=1 Tax=Leptopilina boulardi TaxID=63433 RepID=UPI0021F63B73|nr:uncharacterized protein LOC127280772 [Leptopilina boulardi]